MPLEKFTKQQSPDQPAVTIRKNGSLCINHRAVEQFKLEGLRFVSLYYDQKECLLGIKPEIDDSDFSVFRIFRERGRTFIVWCQSFLRSIQIPYKEGSKIYRADWDEKRGMILVKVS
jgi:hypothetical protein